MRCKENNYVITDKEFIQCFQLAVAKFEEKCSKKMLTPPFTQKLFTFVKQFILDFEEFPRIRGKLET